MSVTTIKGRIRAADTEDVVARIPKDMDVETWVRVIVVNGAQAVEVRDRIVSLGKDGRGYYLPRRRHAIEALILALETILDSTEES